jgi:two-component system chemotaxis response regulator CheY
MSFNVLVVDDSDTMRAMIKRALGMCGLDIGEIYEAANGIEALAQMHDHAVSVVFLDINMPVMNGVKLLKRVHDDPRLCGVPVIVASTDGSETRIRELMDAGARGYVRKPFRPEQVRDALLPIIGPVRTGEVPAPRAIEEDDLSF